MKQYLLTFAILFTSIFYSRAEDFKIVFDTTGTEAPIDSVMLINQTTKDTAIMSVSDTLILREIPTSINTQLEVAQNEIKIYPNPANELSKLEFSLEESGSISIEIFNIKGTCVVQKTGYLDIGIHQFSVEGLKPGMYITKVQTESTIRTGKLLWNGSNGVAKIQYLGTFSGLKNKSSVWGTLLVVYHTEDDLLLTVFGEDKTYATYYSNLSYLRDDVGDGTTIQIKNISCKDDQSNTYPVSEIDNNYWMAENLAMDVDGSWLYQDETIQATYYKIYNYGRLYDWKTAQEVCPSGWHLPSKEEWEEMIQYVDNRYDNDRAAGALLKWDDQLHQYSYWSNQSEGIDGDGTNSTGFAAYAGGAKYWEDGTCYNIGKAGYWWCSTENQDDTSRAYFVKLSYDSDDVMIGAGVKQYGFSVRCVKAK